MSSRIATKNVFRRRRITAPVRANKPVTKAQVKQMIVSAQEIKDFTVSGTGGVDAAGTIIPITPIPQGDTSQTRDGDQVILKHLEMHVSRQIPTTPQIVRIRMILFKWLGEISVSPSVAQILNFTGSVQAPISSIEQEALNAKQLVILVDSLVALDTYNSVHVNSYNMPLKGKVIFSPGSSTDSYGGLYLLFVSDGATSTVFCPCEWNTKVTFTDS